MALNIILPIIFGLLSIGAGLLLFKAGMVIFAKAKESLSWPYQEGEIAHSAVLLQTKSMNKGGSNSSVTTYKADIVYRYKVNDIDYSSSKISACDFSTSYRDNAQNIVVRYPDKSKVKVFYNPSNPSDCLLEPGNESGVKLIYIGGGFFILLGSILIITSLIGH